MHTCKRCKYYHENADYPEKKGTHCYFFNDWNNDECTLHFYPLPSEDTAEENLKDNQVKPI